MDHGYVAKLRDKFDTFRIIFARRWVSRHEGQVQAADRGKPGGDLWREPICGGRSPPRANLFAILGIPEGYAYEDSAVNRLQIMERRHQIGFEAPALLQMMLRESPGNVLEDADVRVRRHSGPIRHTHPFSVELGEC